ncbi:MAG: glycosyl hydrolase family 79 C-terminal domain-containing protein [Xanthobacteraceae bacterium]
MQRRRLLTGLASVTAGLLARRAARAQPVVAARLMVDTAAAGRGIAADFIGLSFESAILAGGEYFSPRNRSLLGLVRGLGESGVIRIGGNSSERTVWNPGGATVAEGSIAITPFAIDQLAAALCLTGWRLIYGLNLARGEPQAAAEEAAYVAHAVGPQLLAFQIGNEPDGFGRWTAVRPKGYDAAAFLAEWARFHAAIRARVPDAPFAGPDVAIETDWVAAFAAAAPAGLALLTRHYYADGPAGAPHVSLEGLMRSGPRIEPVLRQLDGYGRSFGLPYRIVETNSIFNEGEPGVSDTLGAALWALDLMFRCAAELCAGVNFHGGEHNFRPGRDKAYTPIAAGADGRRRATPLYYAMLTFGQAARGTLVPARLEPGLDALAAFAVRATDGNLRICLINRDASRAARVTIAADRLVAAASVLRLTGPGLDATAEVTLGGAAVDDLGRWAPTDRENADRVGDDIVVDVPAACAALVGPVLVVKGRT